jgi:abhydrolase domain-containing protein 1/3
MINCDSVLCYLLSTCDPGGILLSHYLIRKGDKALVDAVMLISVCYNFKSGCESLERQGLNLALNRHLVRTLIAVVESQREQLSNLSNIDLEAVVKAKTLKEFDATFTTKMWGYKDTDHYYEEAQISGKLHMIKKPTLCVNAADDMFQPLECKRVHHGSTKQQTNRLFLLLSYPDGRVQGRSISLCSDCDSERRTHRVHGRTCADFAFLLRAT